MIQKTLKVQAVSKFGGLTADGQEWTNAANEALKKEVAADWKKYKGKWVVLELDEKGHYTSIKFDNTQEPSEPAPNSTEERIQASGEFASFQGQTIGMAINNAVTYVISKDVGDKPLPEEVFADTVLKYAKELLRQMRREGLA